MVRVPEAANVTCCCFGGEKMDTLFITTATAFVPDGKQQVNGGAVFKVKMPGGFSGIPETPFADGAAPSLVPAIAASCFSLLSATARALATEGLVATALAWLSFDGFFSGEPCPAGGAREPGPAASRATADTT